MADHPVPNGDDIILPDGTVVGSWNGEDVKDLQVEVQRIMKEQKASGACFFRMKFAGTCRFVRLCT